MDAGTIIRLLLLWIVLLSISAAVGNGFEHFLKMDLSAFESMAAGFVILLAAVQLAAWWVVAFRMPMLLFEILTVIVILLLLVPAWLYRGDIRRRPGPDFPSVFFPALITFALIVLTVFFYRSDADDSFYVSNAALFQQSAIVNPYDSSFGIKTLGTVPMYDFQIWETLIAFIGRVFHLEAVSLMHTFLLPILLIFSASAYLMLGKTLTGSSKKAAIFYAAVTLFHLMGGYAIYSEGSFLLSRLWQGKSIYLTIVLPVTISVLLKNSEKRQKFLPVMLLGCILAGMALNPTSLYVIGFQILFMTVAAAVVKKKPAFFLDILPSVAAAAAFCLMIYLRTSVFRGQIEASSSAGSTFVWDTWKSFFGQGKWYLVLLAISLVIIWIRGNEKARLYFIYTPLVMALALWNPVSGKFVAENITKISTYWRVLWLIPVGTSIAYAIILLLEIKRLKSTVRVTAAAAVLFFTVLSGKWMFTAENYFVKSVNAEKLPEEVISFGDSYLDGLQAGTYPVLLCPDEFSTTLRQKYLNVALIYSREQYVLDLFKYRGRETEASERIALHDFVSGGDFDEASVSALLDKYEVDDVIIGKGNAAACALLEKNQWTGADLSDAFTVYLRPASSTLPAP